MFSLLIDLQGSNLNYVLAPVFIERHIWIRLNLIYYMTGALRESWIKSTLLLRCVWSRVRYVTGIMYPRYLSGRRSSSSRSWCEPIVLCDREKENLCVSCLPRPATRLRTIDHFSNSRWEVSSYPPALTSSSASTSPASTPSPSRSTSRIVERSALATSPLTDSSQEGSY